MSIPSFLSLSSADWMSLGLSAHRQISMSLEERVEAVGVDPIAEYAAHRADPFSKRSLQEATRGHILRWLADQEVDRLLGPS